MSSELEQCRSGGWKIEVDFEEARDTIQDKLEPAVDSDHLVVFYFDDVKCSLVKSSGVLRVRSEDKEEAQEIIEVVAGK